MPEVILLHHLGLNSPEAFFEMQSPKLRSFPMALASP
jgi:hypothetical protein